MMYKIKYKIGNKDTIIFLRRYTKDTILPGYDEGLIDVSKIECNVRRVKPRGLKECEEYLYNTYIDVPDENKTYMVNSDGTVRLVFPLKG